MNRSRKWNYQQYTQGFGMFIFIVIFHQGLTTNNPTPVKYLILLQLKYQILLYNIKFELISIDFINRFTMQTKTIALLITLLGAISMFYTKTNPFQPQIEQHQSQFSIWKKKFGMTFKSEFEEAYRQKIFIQNLIKINLHNSNKHKTYQMEVNQFTGMTEEEFAQQYLGTIVPTNNVRFQEEQHHISVGNVDWRSQGAVTPVKNQGSCGSCWAFSTTGALQGLSKIGYQNLQSFSEQQLVDCSGKYGNSACSGGLMDNAFKFVKAHGIVTQEQYPYKAVKQTCSKDGGSFKISGFTDIRNCNDLANALVGRPVSVAVDATNWSPYKTGVFNNCQARLNHGVLLVGVTDEYWIVKNSWGTAWGQNGYIRLSKGNTCGICTAASYPNK